MTDSSRPMLVQSTLVGERVSLAAFTPVSMSLSGTADAAAAGAVLALSPSLTDDEEEDEDDEADEDIDDEDEDEDELGAIATPRASGSTIDRSVGFRGRRRRVLGITRYCK